MDYTTPLDVQAIRADFPVLHQEVREGVPLVYLDNAATSQKPVQVIEAMDDYYRRYNANVHRGIHKLSEEATAAYEGAREVIKEYINAPSSKEVIYTRGTTEGINLVAWSWGRQNLGPGDVVIATEMEHHSNIVPWQMLSGDLGFTLRYIPVTQDGRLDMAAYREMLDESVKLVTFVHSSNVVGTINPAAEIIAAAHAVGALTLVDAAQSAPHLGLDVQALDADFAVFSSHKMLGPTGFGVLYGKRELLEEMPPFMGGGDMIRRVTLDGSRWNDLPWKFEAGTPAIAQAIGFGRAVEYINDVGLDAIHLHEKAVTGYALERLAEVPGVTILGPEDASQRGGLAAFTLGDVHAHDVAEVLNHHGVAVRAGHHCAMPLHEKFNVVSSARASFYLYNTFAEVDQLIEALYAAKKLFL